eukprot:IDg14897t1
MQPWRALFIWSVPTRCSIVSKTICREKCGRSMTPSLCYRNLQNSPWKEQLETHLEEADHPLLLPAWEVLEMMTIVMTTARAVGQVLAAEMVGANVNATLWLPLGAKRRKKRRLINFTNNSELCRKNGWRTPSRARLWLYASTSSSPSLLFRACRTVPRLRVHAEAVELCAAQPATSMLTQWSNRIAIVRWEWSG